MERLRLAKPLMYSSVPSARFTASRHKLGMNPRATHKSTSSRSSAVGRGPSSDRTVRRTSAHHSASDFVSKVDVTGLRGPADVGYSSLLIPGLTIGFPDIEQIWRTEGSDVRQSTR